MNYGAELKSKTAYYWRRVLWATAETGRPSDGLFDDAVYADGGLTELIGDERYTALVDRLIAEPDKSEIQEIARNLLESIFPYKCRCRRHSELDRDILDFSFPNIYRSLYFSDDSVSSSMIVLFNRTPEVQLLQCEECGDVWLHALDQVEWIRHLVFIDPDHLAQIEEAGVWPDTLDRFEDAWVKAFGHIGRKSANLKEWQVAHNSVESLARFGK